jgi:sodium transport system ATP-binding protein
MLRLEGVGKSFYDPHRGEIRAVDGMDAHLDDGVVALVGANGAGKSTLLRMVTTLLVPDRGRVLVAGHDTRTAGQAVRARLGYLSTTTRMYPRLTGRELLAYVGGFYGLVGANLDQRITRICDEFAIADLLDGRIQGFSTGQLQRLNLARTLLPDPDLLVLDEPTTGLDVVVAREFIATVRAARRPGRLIIIATHVLREVELVADRLLVLHAGRLLWDGNPRCFTDSLALETAIHGMLASGRPVAEVVPVPGVDVAAGP